MKHFFLLVVVTLLSTNVKSQEYSDMKENPNQKTISIEHFIGKTYIAIVRQSCKRTTTGAYMINTYCELKFAKDSVNISVYSDRFEDNTGTNYKWIIENNQVKIQEFDTYGVLNKQGLNLIGREEYGNGLFKEIVFKEIE